MSHEGYPKNFPKYLYIPVHSIELTKKKLGFPPISWDADRPGAWNQITWLRQKK